MKDKITFVLIVGVMVYVNLDGYLYLNIYPWWVLHIPFKTLLICEVTNSGCSFLQSSTQLNSFIKFISESYIKIGRILFLVPVDINLAISEVSPV